MNAKEKVSILIVENERLKAERDRYRELVEKAYREGFNDGYRTGCEDMGPSGGKLCQFTGWKKSTARKALEGK